MAQYRKYRKTWHVTHFVLTVITGGLWLPIWILCGLMNSQHNKQVERRQMQEFLKQAKKGRR